MKSVLTRCLILSSALAVFYSAAAAGEKGLMHCFAFTEIEDAKDADWKAWFESTEIPIKEMEASSRASAFFS